MGKVIKIQGWEIRESAILAKEIIHTELKGATLLDNGTWDGNIETDYSRTEIIIWFATQERHFNFPYKDQTAQTIYDNINLDSELVRVA